MRRLSRRDWLALGAFLAVTFATSAIAAQFGPGPWFEALKKPSWNPPGAVFPVVWTVLYAMIAVAGWLVWRSPRRQGVGTLVPWGVQLALNGLWSFLFFGLERPGLAMADIVLLLGAIAWTLWTFAQQRRAAAWWLVPYAAWVSFAAVLNFTIWRLNA